MPQVPDQVCYTTRACLFCGANLNKICLKREESLQMNVCGIYIFTKSILVRRLYALQHN